MTTPRRPGLQFTPAVERLEDRAVPATLISTSGALAGANAPVVILGSSDDGQKVLLQSTATNLVTGQIDAPGTIDLFYLDRANGAIQLVTAFGPAPGSGVVPGTVAIGAEPSTPGVKLNAVISADGSAVGFISGTAASQFDNTLPVTTDGAGLDMFVWSSATAKNTLVSADKNGSALGNLSLVGSPSLSANGQRAAFVSTTSAWQSYDNKYIIGPDTPHPRGGSNIYTTAVGGIPRPVTEFKYKSSAGEFYYFYDNVIVDPLGRYMSGDGVSFVATYSTLSRFLFTPGTGADTTNIGRDIERFTFGGVGFAADFPNQDAITSIGQVFYTFDPVTFTYVPSPSAGSVQNVFLARDRADQLFFTATYNPAVAQSGNGLSFGFFNGGGLLPADYVNQNGGAPDLFQAGFADGIKPTISLVSKAAGATNNAGYNAPLDTTPGSIVVSPDARKVTFVTAATNVVAGLIDTNQAADIFQTDLATRTATAVSVTTANRNRTGNAASPQPVSVTADSQLVAFESDAVDLGTIPDRNKTTDIYIRDIGRSTTTLASVVPGNFGAANGRSFNPYIGGSFAGGSVSFNSVATDLVQNNTVASGQQVYQVTTPLISNTATRFVAVSGGPAGFVTLGQTDINGNIVSTTNYQPFGRFAGEVRVATGDVTGDGIPDLILGAGPGGGPRVQEIDGSTGRVLQDFFAFESTFTGGVYVAAGLFTGDNRADVVVGAGELGGPRVRVFNSANQRVVLDRFAYESSSRTGVRVATGDYTGDGLDDLVVAAGTGGGPRVRVFSGTDLTNPTGVADFFAYDTDNRAGVFVSAGDFNNDGKADLVVGTGAGVPTRVRIFNAANLALRDPNQPVTFRDFAPFGPDNTDGARAVLKNITAQANADLVVGNASGLPVVQTYSGNTFGAGTTAPNQFQQYIPFDALGGDFGAYVG